MPWLCLPFRVCQVPQSSGRVRSIRLDLLTLTTWEISLAVSADDITWQWWTMKCIRHVLELHLRRGYKFLLSCFAPGERERLKACWSQLPTKIHQTNWKGWRGTWESGTFSLVSMNLDTPYTFYAYTYCVLKYIQMCTAFFDVHAQCCATIWHTCPVNFDKSDFATLFQVL